jgi:amino acid adenylation domain-containing protein
VLFRSIALQHLLQRSAEARPGAPAVRDAEGETTYADLDAAANRLARAYAELGVGRGDRVAVWLDKSATTVAAMQAALRLGAAYVPVDPMSPPARATDILGDCAVAALVTTEARAGEVLQGDLAKVPTVVADGAPSGLGLAGTDVAGLDASPLPDPGNGDDDLAYVLYTSGSTGKPKGVCISHRNALAFVEWAVAEAGVQPDDRLSSHAPFHFDLSVFDLYAAFTAGASVSIVPEGSAYNPRGLVDFALANRITVWYSVPSALILMMDRGGLLEEPDLPFRVVVFAGEPFPVKQLRRLRERLPGVRLLNWYGPTETNVCTAYEVHDVPADQTVPVPIGTAASGDRVWAVKEDGTEAAVGEEGELLCSGPTVALGYWGREPHGDRPYATGDLVRLLPDGNYQYVGRRDHMVKVRGHRVELGDVEAALLAHPAVEEVAVVVAGSGVEARLVGFLSCPAGEPALLELKRHCAERLPRYMILDEARFLTALPRTRNGKVDRLRLQEMASSPKGAHP